MPDNARLPFEIRTESEPNRMTLFIATRGGRDVAMERYRLGSPRKRKEVATKWASDERLTGDEPIEVEDVCRMLESAELEANDAIKADELRQDKAGQDGENRCGDGVADKLVGMVHERYRLGQTMEGSPFAVLKDGPNVARMFRGGRQSLRAEMARNYNRQFGKVPNSSAVGDALLVLEGMALEGTPEPVHLRVAEHGDDRVIDLGSSDGRAIVISPRGWEVVARSPVLFYRTALTGELPDPAKGGDLDHLRGLLNVDDEAWPLLCGWLVSLLFGDIDHPIVLLGGGEGAGKTTAARFLADILDPSAVGPRTPPRDTEAWVIGAAGSWVVPVDNVSTIRADWSDALCRAVTGEALLRRKLYTDDSLAVVGFRRCVLLTSIDPGAMRGDLGSRLMLLELEQISEADRRTEVEQATAFRRVHPLVLGGVLDLAVEVLRILPDTRPDNLPRLAEFGRILSAMDGVLGAAAFETYCGQRQSIVADVIESDPVAQGVLKFVRARRSWEGTSTALFNLLVPDQVPQGWPRNARSLSARIGRLEGALHAVGLSISRGRGADSSRTISLRWGPEPPANADPGANRRDVGATDDVEIRVAPSGIGPHGPNNWVSGATDATDGKSALLSGYEGPTCSSDSDGGPNWDQSLFPVADRLGGCLLE